MSSPARTPSRRSKRGRPDDEPGTPDSKASTRSTRSGRNTPTTTRKLAHPLINPFQLFTVSGNSNNYILDLFLLIHMYRPHPKDGEGYCYHRCVSVNGGRVVPVHFLVGCGGYSSQVLGQGYPPSPPDRIRYASFQAGGLSC